MNMAVAYEKQKKYKEAIKFNTDAIMIRENYELLDSNELVKLYLNRANEHLFLSEFNKSLDDYDEALQIVESMNENHEEVDENLHAKVLISRGALYERAKKFDLSINDIENAQQIMEHLKSNNQAYDKHTYASSYLNMALTYGKKGI